VVCSRVIFTFTLTLYLETVPIYVEPDCKMQHLLCVV